MFFTPELADGHPVLFGILTFVTVLFYLAIIWIIGRMGDNVNQIRKMLEHEIKNRRTS